MVSVCYLQLGEALAHDECPKVVEHAASEQPQPVEEEVLVRVDNTARRSRRAAAATRVTAPAAVGPVAAAFRARVFYLQQYVLYHITCPN